MPDLLLRSRSVLSSLRALDMRATAVSLGVPFYYSESRLDLHSRSGDVRRQTLDYVKRGVDFASGIGADLIYACSMNRGPPDERELALSLMSEGVADCADYALAAGVRFAIEPFPTGELPRISDVDALISRSRAKNLGIVVDAGHAGIIGEPLAESVRRSMKRITHIHLNNNDGVGDLHWPPQRGVLVRDDFRGLLLALSRGRYTGWMSIELSRPRPVVKTMTESRSFVEDILMEIGQQTRLRSGSSSS